MKSPAMSTPRKNTISNQDINILITKQYPSFPPIMEKYPPGYKPLFNDIHDPNITSDEPNYSTDNSVNEK